VIEGDNASGKTTLAEYFRNNSFIIPTFTPEAVALEKQAKEKFGVERVNAFIHYNLFCGNLSIKNKRTLIIRYWISTIAASYADNVFSFDQTMEKAVELYSKLPVPDFVFCLKCRYDIRIDRINERKKEKSDTSDNISMERDKKYQLVLSEMEKLVKNWHNINTVTNNPEQVFALMNKIIIKGEKK
jgi:thymidylate kinase